MKIGILGTGIVGTTIGSKLVALGHEVELGSRTADNAKAAAWVAERGRNASQGTFADAAAHGEIVFNCTNGAGTLDAVLAAAAGLRGKILIDVANPLDFSKGFPPTLFVSNDDSLGERVQKALPDTKVVKALNTMNCAVMVDPSLVPGDHDVFMSGNDVEAKRRVAEILSGFGWKQPIDLGDITTARGTESFLPLWIRLMGALGHANFNVKVVQ